MTAFIDAVGPAGRRQLCGMAPNSAAHNPLRTIPLKAGEREAGMRARHAVLQVARAAFMRQAAEHSRSARCYPEPDHSRSCPAVLG